MPASLQASLSPAARWETGQEWEPSAGDAIREPQEQLPGQSHSSKTKKTLSSLSPLREAALCTGRKKVNSGAECQARTAPAGGQTTEVL